VSKHDTAPEQNETTTKESSESWHPITVPDIVLQLSVAMLVIYIVMPSGGNEIIPDDILFFGQLDEAIAGILAWQAIVALWRGQSFLFRKLVITPRE
jgi:uncharacterized membrane protein YkvA (DUF1232 family)